MKSFHLSPGLMYGKNPGSGRLSRLDEVLAVMFLLGCAVYLSIWLLGVYVYQLPMAILLAIPAALLFLYGCATCARRFGMLRELVVMALLGYLGMLMGLMADYGELGLLALSNELCRVPLGSGWMGWRDKFVQAPWTHVGMFIGCNLGGCWRRRLFAHSSSRQLLLGILALSNVGMLLGMSLSHNLFPPPDDNLARQLLQMPIQMSLLMAGAMLVFREGALYLCKAMAVPHSSQVMRRC